MIQTREFNPFNLNQKTIQILPWQPEQLKLINEILITLNQPKELSFLKHIIQPVEFKNEKPFEFSAFLLGTALIINFITTTLLTPFSIILAVKSKNKGFLLIPLAGLTTLVFLGIFSCAYLYDQENQRKRERDISIPFNNLKLKNKIKKFQNSTKTQTILTEYRENLNNDIELKFNELKNLIDNSKSFNKKQLEIASLQKKYEFVNNLC
ncbi:MAG: hypothetical protein Q8K60_06485 [Parachlamydiaceae bacterium]|nr:hypothetical protein [Parachlamydiaceae bacterium]